MGGGGGGRLAGGVWKRRYPEKISNSPKIDMIYFGWNFKYFTAPSQHLQTMFVTGSNQQSSALPNIHIIHLAAQCSKGRSRLNCWC